MHPTHPAISVLLPVYKEPLAWVGLAIESILNQTFTDFELIILLDNPEDKPLYDFIKTYEKDKRVRFEPNTNNIGLPKTLNKGIALARAKYIARIDADDIALPQRLHRQFTFLEQQPEIALCGTQVEKIDAAGYHISHSNSCTDTNLIPKIAPYVNVLTHPTWMIRREIFEVVGEYRDFPNAEDYDLVMRILDAGFKITNLEEVLLQYRVHSKGQTWGASLSQKVCLEYIRELHLQRQKQPEDNFDARLLRDKIAFATVTHGDAQQKAQAYLFQAMSYGSQQQRIKKALYLLRSFSVSSLQRRYYFRWLRARIRMYFKI